MANRVLLLLAMSSRIDPTFSFKILNETAGTDFSWSYIWEVFNFMLFEYLFLNLGYVGYSQDTS